jgi:hypothetical protein
MTRANDRLGWFRYYVNRFNRLQQQDSAQMQFAPPEEDEHNEALINTLTFAVWSEEGNYKAPFNPENQDDSDTEPRWMANARELLNMERT